MKKLIPALLLVLLLAVSVSALAEDCPVNPYRDRVEEILSGQVSAASGTLSISLQQTSASIGYDSDTEWTATISGGTAPYTVQFVLGTLGDIVDYTYVLNSEGSQTFTDVYDSVTYSYRFYAPNTYTLIAVVCDSVGNIEQAQLDNIKVAADADHPSIETVAASIAASCTSQCTTDYERVVCIHDYLINHAYYDLTYSYYGPDGVLLRGTGVCDSYSKAFSMMLKAVGIDDVYRVTGGDHAWNIAKIDGTWTMFDVTWDDPAGSAIPVSGQENHLFFGATTEIITKSGHSIEDDESGNHANSCTSYALNYAIRNGDAQRWFSEALSDTPSLANQLSGWSSGLSKKLTLPYVAVKMISATQFLPVSSDATSVAVWLPLTEYINTTPQTINGIQMPIRAAFDMNITGNSINASLALDEMPAVTLPANTEEIGENAFAGDSKIVQVTLPSGVTTIGSGAFASCSNLYRIYIPSSVTNIADDCLSNSSRVTVVCPSGSTAAIWAANKGIPVINE